MLYFAYIQKRRPGWTLEQFRSRWRQHWELATTMPGIMSHIGQYVQTDILCELEGSPEVTVGYDAVGEEWITTPGARGFPEGPELDILAADTEQYRGVVGLHFAGQQRILTGTPEGPCKLFVFTRRRDRITRPEFDAALLDSLVSTSLSGTLRPANGVAVGFATVDTSHFDCVVSIWLSGTDAARDLLGAAGWRSLERALDAVASRPDTYTLVGQASVLLRDPTNSYAEGLA